MITTDANVDTRMISRAPLANQYISGKNALITKFLDAQSLGF